MIHYAICEMVFKRRAKRRRMFRKRRSGKRRRHAFGRRNRGIGRKIATDLMMQPAKKAEYYSTGGVVPALAAATTTKVANREIIFGRCIWKQTQRMTELLNYSTATSGTSAPGPSQPPLNTPVWACGTDHWIITNNGLFPVQITVYYFKWTKNTPKVDGIAVPIDYATEVGLYLGAQNNITSGAAFNYNSGSQADCAFIPFLFQQSLEFCPKVNSTVSNARRSCFYQNGVSNHQVGVASFEFGNFQVRKSPRSIWKSNYLIKKRRTYILGPGQQLQQKIKHRWSKLPAGSDTYYEGAAVDTLMYMQGEDGLFFHCVGLQSHDTTESNLNAVGRSSFILGWEQRFTAAFKLGSEKVYQTGAKYFVYGDPITTEVRTGIDVEELKGNE